MVYLIQSPTGAVEQVEASFEALHATRGRPTGTLRLTMPRALGALLILPLSVRYRLAYPGVALDISLDDSAVDLVAAGFDAGIRLGQAVAQDMVAVRLTPALRWSVVGAPAYLARAGRPGTPEELTGHDTIGYRFLASGALHRWSFQRDGHTFQVETAGKLVANDTGLIRRFALAGLGLAYLPDMEVGADIAAGRLERVVQAFVPSTSGLFLYFPVRTQQQPTLRAFIDIAVAEAAALSSAAFFSQ